MAIYREDIIRVNLEGGTVSRTFADMQIGEGDSNGNRYGVVLYRNGEQVPLTGAACVGYFIRPDGITLVISGQIENGKAFVTLPAAAYAVQGHFTLSIKLSGDGFTGTIRIVGGDVVDTTTGDIADPGSQIPSLSDYEALAEAAQDAADTIDGISVSAALISGTRYKIAVTKT